MLRTRCLHFSSFQDLSIFSAPTKKKKAGRWGGSPVAQRRGAVLLLTLPWKVLRKYYSPRVWCHQGGWEVFQKEVYGAVKSDHIPEDLDGSGVGRWTCGWRRGGGTKRDQLQNDWHPQWGSVTSTCLSGVPWMFFFLESSSATSIGFSGTPCFLADDPFLSPSLHLRKKRKEGSRSW